MELPSRLKLACVGSKETEIYHCTARITVLGHTAEGGGDRVSAIDEPVTQWGKKA